VTRWPKFAWPSPTSCRRSGRSSAPSVLGIIAVAYLAAYGARTPLLALRGLLRVRNLALIVVPAAVIGAVALALVGRVDDRVSAGALALAVAPAPFIGPGIVGGMRGRADLAGALVLGTVLVSLLLVGGRGALASASLFTATEAYALPAMFGNALPTVRDRLLEPLRWIGLAAAAAALVVAALAAPAIDGVTVAVALALLVSGVVSSVIAAYVTGRDLTAAIAGGGLRDPILALAFVALTAGPESAGVPLAYGVFCLGLAALALRAR
jgi:hypothetical protein